MTAVMRMMQCEKKMGNRSPKPAKRLQHSLAAIEWQALSRCLGANEWNALVMQVHPRLIHRPQ